MMRILVTFAVRAEFSQWRSRHPFVPYEFENWEKRRDFDLLKANFGSNEVTVLLTGIGGENADKALRTVPIEIHDVCICTGLAGALDAGLKPGDVVVARTSKTIDQELRVESDAVLVDFAVACGARAVKISVTSEKIVATADEKQELSRSGSVVEMESSHILTAAEKHHVPAVAVRAISDAADEDLPVDFGRIMDSRGHLKYGGLLKEVGLHPYRLAPLMKFAGQSRAAAGSLADFLDRFISAITAKWKRVPIPDLEEVSAT
jgi:adenosylhomocysteine nucleosidase